MIAQVCDSDLLHGRAPWQVLRCVGGGKPISGWRVGKGMSLLLGEQQGVTDRALAGTLETEVHMLQGCWVIH